MSIYKLLILVFIILVSHEAFARQVRGRPTLPSDCLENEHWVRDHSKDRGSWTAYCRVGLGGVAASRGYRFWAPKFRAGAPGDWPNPTEKPAKWTEGEIEITLAALERIPEQLWMSRITGIYRFVKSKDFPNSASSGNGYIALYDTLFSGKNNLVRILSHECAHEFYAGLSDEEKFAYKLATGWVVKQEMGREVPILRRRSGFVRHGCDINVNEDLACNIEFFLFEPERLKTLAPSAYGWIWNQFGDSFKLRK